MERAFNAIGQGGFYTEKFNNFNMVFDCGSETDVKIINKSIEEKFDKGEKIDAVFISHLHNDHVNGLDHLINYCNVQRVFLPLLTEEQKVILLIDSYCRGFKKSDFNVRLIESPEETLGKSNVIYVKPDNKNRSNDNSSDVSNADSYDIKSLQWQIDSGTQITFSNEREWIFIPYNFREDTRVKKLKDELNKEKINLKTINDFETAWKDTAKRDKIKNAYNSVRGDLNTNSMVIYSGPRLINDKRIRMLPYCDSAKCRIVRYCTRNNYNVYNVGCLYLGDYDSKGERKWEKLKDRYKNYWDKIGVIQLPHHGSHHNYNDELLHHDGIECIISAGFRNRFNHPHIDVVRKIDSRNVNLHIVNEFAKTTIYYSIIHY